MSVLDTKPEILNEHADAKFFSLRMRPKPLAWVVNQLLTDQRTEIQFFFSKTKTIEDSQKLASFAAIEFSKTRL